MASKKSVWAFVLVMVLMFQLIIPVGIMSSYAAAGEDISSFVTVTRGAITVSSGGVEIAPQDDGSYKGVPKDASIKMEYNFSLPNHLGGDGSGGFKHYKKDDYFVIPFPADLTFDVLDTELVKDGITIASITIVTNEAVTSKAIITFTTDKAFDNVTGWLKLKGSFSEAIKNDPTIEKIDFSFTATGTINIVKIPKNGADIAITKTGIYISSSESIKWTILLGPKEDISGVVLTDKLTSNNHTYIDGTFAVNGVATSAGLTTGPGNAFRYAFPTTISAVTTQSITYETLISSGAFNGAAGTATFQNTANVSSGAIGKSANGKVTINLIAKSGVANTDRTIDWTITVNQSGKSISGASITDTIPTGCALSPGSVKISRGGISTSVTSDTGLGYYQYTSNPLGPSVLTYQFNGLLTGPAVLTYQTIVTDPDAYNSNNKPSFTNKAVLNWDGNKVGTPSAVKTVQVGTGVLSKSVVGPTITPYAFSGENITEWRITINSNKITITGASITDTIPSGLEYIEGTLKVVKGTDINGTDLASTAGAFTTAAGMIRYNFPTNSSIKDTYTISYKTKITDHSVYTTNVSVKYTNAATLSGTGINGVQEATASKTYTSEILSKSALGYDYNTRIMSWKIYVNKNGLPLTDLVVSDLLPPGLEISPGSFQIQAISGGAVDMTFSMESTSLSFVTFGAANIVSPESFTYKFPIGQSTYQYIITFDTMVKELVLNKQGTGGGNSLRFTNQANISSSGGGFFTNLTVSAIKDIKNQIVGKGHEYKEGDYYIKWKLPINANKITLEDIIIEDALQSSLVLDKDSIKLYKMIVSPTNGALSKGSSPEAITSTAYNVTLPSITNGNTFTFGIPGKISEAYQLEFITGINDFSKNIANRITFGGVGVSGTNNADTFKAKISQFDAGVTGSLQKVTIHKKNVVGISLSGVEFKLMNENGTQLKTATTDENGYLSFGGLLLYKTYSIKEIKSLAGYLIDETVHKFMLTSSETDFNYTFVNYKAKGDITIKKVDDKSVGLPGAVFTLYNTSNDAIQTASSSTTGQVIFTGVEVGKYTIKETTPPPGYYKSNVEITAEVTLKPVNKVIVSTSAVEIINAKIPKGPPGSPPPFITPPAFTTPTVITPPGVNPPGEPPIDVDGDIPAGGDVLLPDSGLPKTGGTSRANIYFTGGLLILLGIMLRRKTA